MNIKVYFNGTLLQSETVNLAAEGDSTSLTTSQGTVSIVLGTVFGTSEQWVKWYDLRIAMPWGVRIAETKITYTGSSGTAPSDSDIVWGEYDTSVVGDGSAKLVSGDPHDANDYGRNHSTYSCDVEIFLVTCRRKIVFSGGLQETSVSNLPADQSFVPGTTFALTATVPTCPGHRFLGWSASVVGTVTGDLTPGGAITITTKYDCTFFARWHFITHLPIRNSAGTGLLRNSSGMILRDD